jgi:hypothetical protein
MNARIGDAATARLEIDEAQSGCEPDRAVVSSALRLERIGFVSPLGVVSLIALVAIIWPLRPVPVPPGVWLEVTTPPTTDPMSLAISPDGSTIVFAATAGGRSQLWIRTLHSTSARPLAKTENGGTSLLVTGQSKDWVLRRREAQTD